MLVEQQALQPYMRRHALESLARWAIVCPLLMVPMDYHGWPPVKRPGRQKRGRPTPWLPRRARVWLVRCLILVATLQFSGLLHDIPDLLRSVAGLADYAGDGCPDEERGGRCPPGCSDCSCTPQPAALPTSAARSSCIRAPSQAAFSPDRTGDPRPDHEASVYRPPRDDPRAETA